MSRVSRRPCFRAISMRINFITAGFGLSGGTKAIFEFANNLTDRGHQVSVICSLTPFVFAGKWFNYGNIATKTLRLFKKSKGCKIPVEWFDVKAKLLCLPSFSERYIPDGDVIVATWWETAYFVAKYGISKGKKFYLAQDFETWAGREKEVKKSYNLGLKNIVNSKWLKNTLEKEAGAKVEAVILHAPDHNQFYPEEKNQENNRREFRILIPYRDEARKGTKEGIGALKIVKEKHPDIKLVMFGQKQKGLDFYGLENEVEYHLAPVKDDLRRLYNSCGIFCYPAIEDGFGMPPMEAMACGIPVVATNAGAITEYASHGETALISPPGDTEAMAKNIIELMENEGERKRLAANALLRIKQFSWEEAARQLEQVFRK